MRLVTRLTGFGRGVVHYDYEGRSEVTVHVQEEVVTRQDRRRQAKQPRLADVEAKHAKARKKLVRQHRSALKMTFSEEMVTGKAVIEALNWKHRKGAPSRADMKLAAELRTATEWYVYLASMVTRYISRECGGFIWGGQLDDLYDEIAKARFIRKVCPGATVDDVEYAVDIAVSRKLLRRQEAAGVNVPECTCIEILAA